MKITRAPGGSEERQVDVEDLVIPDLWHVQVHLKRQGEERAAQAVLECWHLAHDMLRALKESSDPEIEETKLGEHPNWNALEEEVLTKLRILRATWEGLPNTEISDKIRRELILPGVLLLAKFCAAVTLEDHEGVPE
jgi:hypothetical protein